MSKISYKLNNNGTLYGKEAFEAVIDGIPTKWFFNVNEFMRSSGENGYCEIFLGNCLLSGCCGVYMEVIHQGKKILWKRVFEQMDGIRICDESVTMPDKNEAYEVENLFVSKDNYLSLPIEFNKAEYQTLARELTEENIRLKK
jgi:hypothetical protein